MSLFLLLLSGFLFLFAFDHYHYDLSGCGSLVFGYWASWMCRFMFFIKCGNFSAIISSKYFFSSCHFLLSSDTLITQMLVNLILPSHSVSLLIFFVLFSSLLEMVLQVCQFFPLPAQIYYWATLTNFSLWLYTFHIICMFVYLFIYTHI